MMNINAMMSKFKKLQAELDKKLNEFDNKEFDFNYKNYVKVKIKGSLEIINIEIDNQLVDPDDKQTLQEMIAEAVNEAIVKTTDEKEKLTKSLTPKMPMPF